MYTLYIGNRNFSSWSLRSWVLLRQARIPFREQMVSLYAPDKAARLRAVSPSGRVPCLHDGETVVWDTLAIAEYLAERHPGLWPVQPTARAWARSVAAEMHSGFVDLRNEFGMDLRLRQTRRPSAGTAADIARIDAIWREGRGRFGGAGDFLCGAFGIVDAFWCPVALRFQSYGVALAGTSQAYLRSLLALPAMVEWAAGAAQEREGPESAPGAQVQQQ